MVGMSGKLRVIVVQSWVDDVARVLAALRGASYEVEHEQVDLEPARGQRSSGDRGIS